MVIRLCIGLVFCLGLSPSLGRADAIQDDVARVCEAGKEGAGFRAAQGAAERLRQIPVESLPRVFDGFAQANPIAQNWLRGIVTDVMRRQGKVSADLFVAYVRDASRNPDGRAVALEWIGQLNPELQAQVIDQSLEDPSLAIRGLAVERAIAKAQAAKKEKQEVAAREQFKLALNAARHPQQVETILKSLKELGETIRPADHFKVITTWKVAAPFDNVGGVGFAKQYDPEVQFAKTGKVDLTQSYKGKSGVVQWQDVASTEDSGEVDLAKAFNKEKGAICYAYAELTVSQAQPAQVRLGSTGANKIWVNGVEVTKNEVYHAGNMIDQYVADVSLQPGVNRILLKLCQNEQTEDWAQDWTFQFRVTDPTGKGL